MLVHRRVTPPPNSMSLVPIYTPGWRETKWRKVPCLRKQREGRGLNLQIRSNLLIGVYKRCALTCCLGDPGWYTYRDLGPWLVQPCWKSIGLKANSRPYSLGAGRWVYVPSLYKISWQSPDILFKIAVAEKCEGFMRKRASAKGWSWGEVRL